MAWAIGNSGAPEPTCLQAMGTKCVELQNEVLYKDKQLEEITEKATQLMALMQVLLCCA